MAEKDYSRRPDPQRFTQERFYRVVGTFPERAQEYISSLSSSLLEEDIRNKLMHNPQNTQELEKSLAGTGLSIKEVGFVLKFFGLPHQSSQELNKK